MAWPVVFLVTVLLLACAASVPGITRASNLADSIATMQCGISVMIDDILNGNTSNDQTTFFLGANGLNNRLVSLNGSATNINNEFTTKLSPGINSIATDYASAKDKLEKLGDGTNVNSSFNLVYTVKPTAASANGMASAFNTVLGTPADPQSLNGVLYQIVGGLGTAMTNVKGSIDGFNAQIGTIQTTITSTTDLINNFASSINSIDNNVGDLFSSTASFMDPLKLAFLGFYGAVIGLSVIALLGAIIMACFDKPGCRHLMYFSCLLIFIITILGFLLSFILSFVIPVMFLTCTTIDSTISTTSAFNSTSLLMQTQVPSSILTQIPSAWYPCVSQAETDSS